MRKAGGEQLGLEAAGDGRLLLLAAAHRIEETGCRTGLIGGREVLRPDQPPRSRFIQTPIAESGFAFKPPCIGLCQQRYRGTHDRRRCGRRNNRMNEMRHGARSPRFCYVNKSASGGFHCCLFVKVALHERGSWRKERAEASSEAPGRPFSMAAPDA
jgi:hypothetical protein